MMYWTSRRGDSRQYKDIIRVAQYNIQHLQLKEGSKGDTTEQAFAWLAAEVN
jgi:hypothetical protein